MRPTSPQPSPPEGGEGAYGLLALAPTPNDREREIRIAALKRAMDRAPNIHRRRLAWNEMQAEIRARSPQMVAAMEAAKQLTPA